MFIDGSFVDGAGNGTYGGLATKIGRRLQVFINLDEKPIGWY